MATAFTASESTQLSLVKGRCIVVEKMPQGNWWFGREEADRTRCGWFPASCVAPGMPAAAGGAGGVGGVGGAVAGLEGKAAAAQAGPKKGYEGEGQL